MSGLVDDDAAASATAEAVAAEAVAAEPHAPGPAAEAEGEGAEEAASKQGASNVLKLKGLPYTCTAEALQEFFAGFALTNISFVGEPDGRPSGLAFAEFESKEEAIKALSKNGEYIGERYVRLLHVPRSEMEEQVRMGTLAIPGSGAKGRARMVQRAPGAPGAGRGGGYMGGPGGMVPPMHLMGGPPMGGRGGMPFGGGAMHPGNGHAWSGAYGNPASLAAQFGGMNLRGGMPPGVPGAGPMGGRGGGGGMGPLGPGAPAQPGGMGMPPGPHAPAPMGMAMSQAQVMSNAHAAVHSPASSTVKVRGLPYRSSPQEILGFFQGFQYLEHSLQIGLDTLGRPSGEAWLCFANPGEALKSVRELNRHYLGNRYLELSIC